MTDQVIETRQDCFKPATMRLNCLAPKFCEVKVVTPAASEVKGRTAKDMIRLAAT